jgi:tetratricopeptide (TPR) repeat protein
VRPANSPLTESLFVACEQELEGLQEILSRAIAGTGQICFITGEAGAGKTTLTTEFANRALEAYPALLMAVGNCNAQTGIGDPYLPFREVLGQLTGDVEGKLTQGAISQENAGRLQSFLNVSGRAVVDLGPDLIDIFLPGAGLVARAGRLVAGDAGWVKRLNRLQQQRAHQPEVKIATRNSPQDMQQNRIFEQFTQVVVELGAQRPLVIVLDDLHWADESSTSLLFHLARRITNGPILLIGTYRPEDVAFGRDDRRHPLESVVNEIKRLYGEVILPLGQDDKAKGRRFIDALLDARPNTLGEPFRELLLRHTRGQPLFTTELLNGMWNRGDLVEDAAGCLAEGPTLDWNTMPARIEGVIEERISRISPELQELLTVASVEGEVFSAQVLARVQKLGERELLRRLDKELDQQHRLVQEDSVKRVGGQRLSQYRFRHSLLQRFLYNRLSQSEREVLHENIAQAIEELYRGTDEEITGQLARHYEQAEWFEKAADYYLAFGHRAMRLFASGEAANLLRHGLQLLQSLPDSAENAERAVKLQLALGQAQWKLGLAPESMATYQQAAHTARTLKSGEYLAYAALGYDDPRFRFNFPPEPAVHLLEEALDTLGEEDSILRVRVLCGLVRAQGHRMNEVVLTTLANHAIAMARRLDNPQALYAALQAREYTHRQPERIAERLATKDEIVQVAERIGDRAPLLDAYMWRIDDLLAVGDIEAVDADIAAMQKLVEEVREPFYDYCQTTKRAMRALLVGRFDEAEHHARQGKECNQQMDVDNAEGVFGMQMFSIRRLQGRLEGLAPVIRHFVSHRSAASCWHPGLALIYSELGEETEARAEFERLAVKDFADIPRDALWQTCLSYLSDVCCFLGDRERAATLYRLLTPFARLAIVVGNSVACNGAASRNLGQLAAVRMQWDRAEAHFQHAIEFNTRLQALPWLAVTKYQYSRMLLARGDGDVGKRARALLAEALDTARSLGMQGLEQEIERINVGN